LERLEALDVAAAQRPQPFAGLAQKAHEPGLDLLARLFAAAGDMYREGERGVALGQRRTVDLEPFEQLVRRVDQRRGENRKPALGRERKRVRAVGGDPHLRVRGLDRARHQRDILGPEIFALERELLAAPGGENVVERLVEALAALLHRN